MRKLIVKIQDYIDAEATFLTFELTRELFEKIKYYDEFLMDNLIVNIDLAVSAEVFVSHVFSKIALSTIIDKIDGTSDLAGAYVNRNKLKKDRVLTVLSITQQGLHFEVLEVHFNGDIDKYRSEVFTVEDLKDLMFFN